MLTLYKYQHFLFKNSSMFGLFVYRQGYGSLLWRYPQGHDVPCNYTTLMFKTRQGYGPIENLMEVRKIWWKSYS